MRRDRTSSAWTRVASLDLLTHRRVTNESRPHEAVRLEVVEDGLASEAPAEVVIQEVADQEPSGLWIDALPIRSPQQGTDTPLHGCRQRCLVDCSHAQLPKF